MNPLTPILRATCVSATLVLAACHSDDDSTASTTPATHIEYDHISGDRRPLAPKANGGIPSLLCVRGGEPEIDLREISRSQISERSIEIHFFSAAMGREESVLITLPHNFDSSGATQYPLLYLLHGSLENHLSWFNNGAESVLDDHDIIVVSPNGGHQGKYSDFYGTPHTDTSPTPHTLAWETFHIRELLPFIEANFPVRRDTAGRAIAGLSAGGYGATKYASVFPGLFGAAASFSGGLNTTYQYPLLPAVYSAGQPISLLTGDDPEPCTWGDPVIHQVLWIGNDPTHLAENMQGTRIFLAGGNGTQGELDENPTIDPVERQTYDQTLEYIEALDAIGLPHSDDLYGGGTHTWPYWLRELDRFLDWQAPFWGAQISAPLTFNHRSVYHRFQAWGWQFAVERNVDEFMYLRDVSADGFDVSGSGILHVLSAPVYESRSGYRVTTGDRSLLILSSETGRLEFSVDIAPSGNTQQREFDQAAIDNLPGASVTIEALP